MMIDLMHCYCFSLCCSKWLRSLASPPVISARQDCMMCDGRECQSSSGSTEIGKTSNSFMFAANGADRFVQTQHIAPSYALL
jgi:hypothetical protein